MFRSIFFLLMITASFTTAQNQTTNNPQQGTWDFNARKIWEISTAGDNEFGRPAEPRIGNDELLYFRDFEKKCSYIFDKDGNLITTFADQNGDAPDISMYINCFTADDEVIIGAMDKLYFFNSSGTLVNSIPNNIFFSFPYTFINKDHFFSGPGALAGIPTGKAEITLIDVKNNTKNIFAEITLSEDEKKLPPGGVILGLVPQILMLYDNESGNIYYTKNSEYKIYCADKDGNIISTFGRNIPKKYISTEQKKEHMKFFLGDDISEEQLTQMAAGLPDSLQYFHNIFFNNGLIFVFKMTHLSTESYSQEIDIFSKEGKYLYKGIIDFADYYFQNPGNVQIKDDTMYAILINKEGVKVVVKYKINIPAMN